MAVNDRGESRPTYEEALAQLTENERVALEGFKKTLRGRAGGDLTSREMQEIIASDPAGASAFRKHARLFLGIKTDEEAEKVKDIITGLLSDSRVID